MESSVEQAGWLADLRVQSNTELTLIVETMTRNHVVLIAETLAGQHRYVQLKGFIILGGIFQFILC